MIAVVQGEDAQRTSEALTAGGFGSTRITSSGGFLQQGNVTFLIGVEGADIPAFQVRSLLSHLATRKTWILTTGYHICS